MTSLGSGVGGNIGGPTVPMPRDIEATAWTEVNKAALGIMSDSIDKAFSEINPRYSTGYLGGFGYKSTAQNPLLDHPLEGLLLTQSFNQMTDGGWQLTYEDLVNQLPPDLLARFLADRNQPFEQRNLSLVTLDNLLSMAAKVVNQTANLSQPAPLTSLEQTRTTLNQLLPFAALKGALANSNEILQSAQFFLTSQGANYPYFDAFQNLINQMQSPLSLMAGVNSSLSDTLNGQLSLQATNAANKAAAQLTAISSQLEKISLGQDLQLINPFIQSLAIVSAALALEDTNTAPLFLSLSLASIGLSTKESSSGILGASFETFIETLNQGLISGLMPKNNTSGNQLFNLLTTLSLIAFPSLSSLILEQGLGTLPQTSPQALKAAIFFAFETALQLVVSSGYVETFYKETIAISGGKEQAQALGSSALAQLTHFLMILSGSIKAKNTPTGLIENEADYLSQGLASATQIEETIPTNQETAAAIALKLSALALDAKDYEVVQEAFNHFLESIGMSQTALEGDLTRINQTARELIDLLGHKNMNQDLTHLVHVI